MSTSDAARDAQHQHDPDAHDGHDGHVEHDGQHGSMRGYLIGFGLSVVLTAIPFWLVMAGVFDSSSVTGVVVLAFAAVQIVVHMVCFLHMNTKSENGWTMLALIFTAVLLVIMLAGSLWVMHHLKVNMMPDMSHGDMQGTQDMQSMP